MTQRSSDLTRGLRRWYVRLCQAVIRADSGLSRAGPGALSRPFNDLSDELRSAAVTKVLELPECIGLMSWRSLGPSIDGVPATVSPRP